MTADEVLLSPPRKEKESTGEGSTPEIPRPITYEELQTRRNSSPINHVEGMAVIGNTRGMADLSDVPLRSSCRCLRLNLKEEADRTTYAELVNSAAAPNSPLEINWEERVIDGDALIIYLTYTEYVRVAEG